MGGHNIRRCVLCTAVWSVLGLRWFAVLPRFLVPWGSVDFGFLWVVRYGS